MPPHSNNGEDQLSVPMKLPTRIPLGEVWPSGSLLKPRGKLPYGAGHSPHLCCEFSPLRLSTGTGSRYTRYLNGRRTEIQAHKRYRALSSLHLLTGARPEFHVSFTKAPSVSLPFRQIWPYHPAVVFHRSAQPGRYTDRTRNKTAHYHRLSYRSADPGDPAIGDSLFVPADTRTRYIAPTRRRI